LKDAAKLLAYLAATLLFAVLVAPPLYWAAEAMARRGVLPWLVGFGFERFFRRALLIGALIFLWPLLRSLGVRNLRELGLERNASAWRDTAAGFFIATVPLLLAGAGLVVFGVYSLRATVSPLGIAERTLSTIVVPLIEEPIFRGLILGVLLRGLRPIAAVLISSAFFSILHFLKAPDDSGSPVSWLSGFSSVANAFSNFAEPLLVLAGFTTLFLIGWILADARLRTRSLWLPIGLHAGWIWGNGVFNKVARREFEMLPWLGRNLLIGLIPLAVLLLTWLLVRWWLKHEQAARV
jgi:uncharacterized protein